MKQDRAFALDSILNNPSSPWMDGSGNLADVVISSRVRLARNLKDTPFPHLLEEKEADQVLDRVFSAVDLIGPRGFGGEIIKVRLDNLSLLDRQVLVEKHLISPQHAESGFGKGLILRQDEAVSIMVNEEDHLRIQCLHSGLELDEAWILASGIDDLCDELLDFAYDERIGYLTSCPTNVGTGLRASVMVHLPALAMANEVSRVLAAVNKLGLVVRGIYGEGTEGQGNVFQISNQISLGQTEKEIIENLSLVAKQVVSEEKRVREGLFKNRRAELEDRVFRALGILSNARRMTSNEAIRLWSDLRLGVEFEMIPGLTMKDTNQILVLSRPNYVQRTAGKSLQPEERDTRRAELIRRHLANRKV
ncbi:MAG: protein arginine kinase [Candidatus Fermentithermobacillus carboniphilus]|uniref:Protein-arginine kinase n=1 Tax=Candidatus Fermentithermobacillus carboniphilus TaxID=3085328 RepID=A0AAT9LAF6_9FIRM|nr:MAG: protein arginine kinase [Candidatus Fermentithermobacillus carboniphilus]